VPPIERELKRARAYPAGLPKRLQSHRHSLCRSHLYSIGYRLSRFTPGDEGEDGAVLGLASTTVNGLCVATMRVSRKPLPRKHAVLSFGSLAPG
jgi:hypothetical protein